MFWNNIDIKEANQSSKYNLDKNNKREFKKYVKYFNSGIKRLSNQGKFTYNYRFNNCITNDVVTLIRNYYENNGFTININQYKVYISWHIE